MLELFIAIFFLIIQIVYWRRAKRQHDDRIKRIPLRIHVNGIRGKSTVTRLIAGMLREAGYRVIGKTTGSAARIIHEDGSETPIKRLGAPTILEQVNMLAEHTRPETQAVVFECMAVNPKYQHISQHKIVQGNITVITNVREDHQEQMGETLPEIADSLANTVPVGGLLITGEARPELTNRLAQHARENQTDFIYAPADVVTDEDIAGFGYLAFKDNVAIGLAIARHLDIPRDIAMRGMQRARPDVGAVFVQKVNVGGKQMLWAPLFAANDRESVIANVDALAPYCTPSTVRIGILNNRYDRPIRAMKFAEIAVQDLNLDYYVTFGAYEVQVTERMIELGYPAGQIINLGDSTHPTIDEITSRIASLVGGRPALVMGMANIHTHQAELLMEYFAEQFGHGHADTHTHLTPEMAIA